ncbi:MAG: LexA family transcriptional regulator [Tagaea sp.]|nr:LexA family transcriptional regulator [Tagaea sp.]
MKLFPSRAEAARIAGRSVDSLADYERGETEVPFAVLKRLCEAKRVRLEWLASGDGSMSASGPEAGAEPGTTRIPVLETKLSAGTGAAALSTERARDHLVLPTAFLRGHINMTPEAVVAFPVVGDSMEPTLREGALALLDRSVRAIDGPGIYALRRGDDLFVKRVARRADGSILLKADNPRYPDDHLAPERVGELQVIGRVGGTVNRS